VLTERPSVAGVCNQVPWNGIFRMVPTLMTTQVVRSAETSKPRAAEIGWTPCVTSPSQKDEAGANGIGHPLSAVTRGIAEERCSFQFSVGRHHTPFQTKDDGQEYSKERDHPE
jgi:hypothetical protein